MINNFIIPGASGPLRLAFLLQMGNPPFTFDPKHVIYVWLDALFKLHHRARITIPTTRCSSREHSRKTGPPTSMSSARTSCASTRSTGRSSSWRSVCRFRRRSSGIRGSTSAPTRCRSHEETSSTRTSLQNTFGVDGVRYYCALRDALFQRRLHHL